MPRFRVLNGGGAVDQSVWVLRELGFTADAVSNAQLNTEPTDPLADYDVIFNAGTGFPAASNATARARLAAFFAGGGGYIGAQAGGVNYLGTARPGRRPDRGVRQRRRRRLQRHHPVG